MVSSLNNRKTVLTASTAVGLLAGTGAAHAALPTEAQEIIDMIDVSALTTVFAGVGGLAATVIFITAAVYWVRKALSMVR